MDFGRSDPLFVLPLVPAVHADSPGKKRLPLCTPSANPMRKPTDLPDDLQGLVRQQEFWVSDRDFKSDSRRLISAIKLVLDEKKSELRIVREKGIHCAPEETVLSQSPPEEGQPTFFWRLRDLFTSSAKSPTFPKVRKPIQVQESLRSEAGIPENLANLLASGDFPQQTEHRAVNAGLELSPVDCTVFAPDRVEREQSALLQVFLHAPNEQQQAKAVAVKSDPEAKERGHKSLVLDAPVGTNFVFDVEVEGFVFPERTDTLLWTGQPEAATFRFEVPKGCKWGQHTGTVRISKDRFPVGRISFLIEVVSDASGARKRPLGKEARHYRVFLLLLITRPGGDAQASARIAGDRLGDVYRRDDPSPRRNMESQDSRGHR
jgi:hypothetical protein